MSFRQGLAQIRARGGLGAVIGEALFPLPEELASQASPQTIKALRKQAVTQLGLGLMSAPKRAGLGGALQYGIGLGQETLQGGLGQILAVNDRKRADQRLTLAEKRQADYDERQQNQYQREGLWHKEATAQHTIDQGNQMLQQIGNQRYQERGLDMERERLKIVQGQEQARLEREQKIEQQGAIFSDPNSTPEQKQTAATWLRIHNSDPIRTSDPGFDLTAGGGGLTDDDIKSALEPDGPTPTAGARPPRSAGAQSPKFEFPDINVTAKRGNPNIVPVYGRENSETQHYRAPQTGFMVKGLPANTPGGKFNGQIFKSEEEAMQAIAAETQRRRTGLGTFQGMSVGQ